MANWQVISLDTVTPQLRAPGTGDGYSFNSGSTQLGVWTTTGLGIGTASPAAKLDVVGTAQISSSLTLSGGTANGVLYLNASKVATSGSALTFDGTNLALTGSGAIYRVPDDGGSFFNSSGNTGIYIQQTGTPLNAFYVDNLERMRLISTGLGIGTSSPSVRLHVKGTAGTGSVLRLEPSTSTTIYSQVQGINGDLVLQADPGNAEGSSSIKFEVDGTERGRFTAGGYFKASNDGTYAASTGALHELKGNPDDNVLRVENYLSSLTQAIAGIRVVYSAAAPNSTTNSFLYCGDNAALRANIRSNGGLANYQANNVDLSDARTKNSITPAASMWDKVGALEIVTYKYNDQTHDDVNLGVIAQQVESVEPVWVDADGFGETPEDGVPLKTVYTKDITFAAIKALQEAMARIEKLEAKVTALEAK